MMRCKIECLKGNRRRRRHLESTSKATENVLSVQFQRDKYLKYSPSHILSMELQHRGSKCNIKIRTVFNCHCHTYQETNKNKMNMNNCLLINEVVNVVENLYAILIFSVGCGVYCLSQFECAKYKTYYRHSNLAMGERIMLTLCDKKD